MKFSIGHRLFVAVLVSFAAVALLGVALVRWRLLEPSAAVPAGDEAPLLAALSETIAAHYRQRQDWSFIPVSAEQRKIWLQQALAAVPAPDHASSRSLGFRIGLLDRERHYLAGVIAHPLVVAFASIDTQRRAVVVDGETIGYLVVARPESGNDELGVAFLLQKQDSLFVVAIFGLMLCGLVAVLLALHFRRPIRQLVAGARQLEQAQFAARLPVQRGDELGELAQAFNQLAARLGQAEHQRRQWLAETAHELRTPLSVLQAQLEALQDGVRSASAQNIDLLRQQVLRVSRRVAELHELAAADLDQLRIELTECDVWLVVEQVFSEFVEKFEKTGLAATLGPRPARAVFDCDAERLRQVLVNLLENSVRYTSAGGTVSVHAVDGEAELELVVDDSAPAVPAVLLPGLGERFFRVEAPLQRQAGSSGIGLALSRRIVEALGGSLRFAPSPLGGLRAVVALPRNR